MLEYAIAAGITSSGADAYMLHVTTTPSVSYAARTDGFDCGIMITASHNPFDDNGIKIINRFGEKLEDEVTDLIEAYLDRDLGKLGLREDFPFASGEKIGRIVDHAAGRNRYIAYLISLASNSYKDLKIGIDAANGAAWMIASSVFAALGANLTLIGVEPDGTNVNRGCGSTHIERLCATVRERHLDIGFAFDGDCDRCIAVDETGTVIDGDKIMYILARRLKSRGMLKNDTVVATVMSNGGLDLSLGELGVKCERTAVGDRFVYERMQSGNYSLGGEQSGHIIMKKYATTGDGLLTAIILTEEVCDTKKSLSALASPVRLLPQITKSIRVKDKRAAVSDTKTQTALEVAKMRIGEVGRVILRESGTENVIRIMVEAESEELCRTAVDLIENAVREGGHLAD
jgi:phosphoglucosamine mutase